MKENIKQKIAASVEHNVNESTFHNLPNEILSNIFTYLPKTRKQIRDFANISKRFYLFSKDPRILNTCLQTDYRKLESNITIPIDKSCAISGTLLATYHYPHIEIFNINDGNKINTIDYPELKNSYWCNMAFTKNEKYLITTDQNGLIKIFDVNSGQPIAQYQNISLNGSPPYYYNQTIKFHVLSEDTFLAVRHDLVGYAKYSKPIVYLYKINSSIEPIPLLTIPGEQLIDITTSENNHSLALLYAKFISLQHKKFLALYDLSTGTFEFDSELKTCDNQLVPPLLHSIKILSDNRIALGGSFGTLYFFQQQDKKLLSMQTNDYADPFFKLPITQSGEYLALGFSDGVKLWDINQGKYLNTITSLRPQNIFFANNDSSIIVRSSDQIFIQHFGKSILETQNDAAPKNGC